MRIVAAMQNGELDPSIAMQLLGQGVTATAPKGDASDPNNAKKRPMDTSGGREGESEQQGEDIEVFLQEAKRVKQDA